MMNSPILQPAYTDFVNTIQYKPYSANGGLFFMYPQVSYNGVIYQYVGLGTPVTPATNPITYLTPDLDSSAVALYAINYSILNKTYAFITLDIPTSILATGNLPLTGINIESNNITLDTTNNLFVLPAKKLITAIAYLKVSTGSAAGVNFTFSTTGTVINNLSSTINVPLSSNNVNVTVSSTIITASNTANLSLSLSSSNGSLAVLPGSVIQITGI